MKLIHLGILERKLQNEIIKIKGERKSHHTRLTLHAHFNIQIENGVA